MSQYLCLREFAGRAAAVLGAGHARVNRSRATVELYVGGVRVFLRWCAASSVTPELTKDAVNAFITDLLDSGAQPATAVARQKALRQYSNGLPPKGSARTTRCSGWPARSR